jgi:hypothetical protein
MGSITRGLSNNITSGGVILPSGITNASVADVTSFSGVTGGGTLVLLSTQTASNSATISFTTGLNSTYDAYEFHFINIAPRTDDALFQFNMSTDAGSNYNVTKTSSYFTAYHNEADNNTNLGYVGSHDLAQETAFQTLITELGNDADQNMASILTIFNPSSTTFVKHYLCTANAVTYHDYSVNSFTSGYGNTTSAVNAVQFKMSSGNFDGIIKLYGLKKS